MTKKIFIELRTKSVLDYNLPFTIKDVLMIQTKSEGSRTEDFFYALNEAPIRLYRNNKKGTVKLYQRETLNGQYYPISLYPVLKRMTKFAEDKKGVVSACVEMDDDDNVTENYFRGEIMESTYPTF